MINKLKKNINKWDQRILYRFNGVGGKYFTKLLRNLSFLGEETIWCILIGIYLFIWYDPFLLAFISTTFLTGLILILVLKQTVKRQRPFERFEENKIIVLERTPSSRSFPSWHSYNVMAQGLLFGLFFSK